MTDDASFRPAFIKFRCSWSHQIIKFKPVFINSTSLDLQVAMKDSRYCALLKKAADVEEQYKKWKELKRKDIESLSEWVQLQPHLPNLDELSLILFHHSCYYRNEATKKCIEAYCTAITNSPEFFANVDPLEKENAAAGITNCISVLPKLSPEGYVIMYGELVNTDPSVYNFDAAMFVTWASTCLDLYQNGCREGHVMVLSFKGVTLRHIAKVSLLSVKKVFHFTQEAIPLRLKAIHFVHPPPFMDKVMSMLIKPFISKEIYDILHVHNTTSILDYIPKECLPTDLGGTLATDEELQEISVKLLEDNAEFVKSYLEEVRADESRRSEKVEGENGMFGSQGTFKKLDID